MKYPVSCQQQKPELEYGLYTCDCNLRARVTELRKSSVEQSVLLVEGFDRRICVSTLGLELHVCIGNLRDSREEEESGEREAKASNGKVNPLHILQRFLALAYADKDDIGAEDWSNNCADSVERLGNVDSELRIPGRSTDGDVGVGSRLERAEAVADDEDGGAKAAKALVQDTWPCD